MKLAVLVASLLTASVSGTLACSFDSQVHALALNMYHEARGEGHDAMQLVGEVTLNRVENKHFPDTVCGVVYQARRNSSGELIRHRCQFSWYCDGRSDNPRNQELWNVSKTIAEGLLDGSIKPLGTDATHYHTTKVNPHWASAYEVVGRYGSHIFYAMGDRL